MVGFDTMTINEMTTQLAAFVPNLVYALVWLFVGYILGGITHTIVKRIFDELKLDKKLSEKRMNYKVSKVFAFFAKWFVYLAFISVASEALGVQTLIDIVAVILGFLPKMVGAAAILIAANFFGLYFKEEVIGGKDIYASMVGKLVYFLVLYLALSPALNLVGIEAALFEQVFLLVVGAFSVGLAIALGWGLKDSVDILAKSYVKKYAKKK